MKQVIDSERIPIKFWLNDIEEGALRQAKNAANLPFVFKHVAIMADAHEGFGVSIGTVLATKDVVIPNAVGVDISCGMNCFKTNIKASSIDIEIIKIILGGIRDSIPMGFNNNSEMKYDDWMPKIEINKKEYPITYDQLNKARHALGSLGSGNHFWELQKDIDDYVWLMIHSGSRNLGFTVANYYNEIAIKLNERFFSSVPTNYQLAFLPQETDEFNLYWNEMTYCMEFAKQNRKLMAYISKQIIKEHIPNVEFTFEHDINHNYAAIEHHFGENVIVHRKGATRVRDGEIGVIPGSQGTYSCIVKGKGNPESFCSCSHGAGRKMSRTKARELLNLEEEKRIMDEQGIVHGIRNINDLDEAVGAYKDISRVMENQKDLVEIVEKLIPLAVVKG